MLPFTTALAETSLNSIASASSEPPSALMKDHPKVCQALKGVAQVIDQLPSALPAQTGRDVIDQGLRNCGDALTALHDHYKEPGARAGKTFELALRAAGTIDATRDTLQKSKVGPSVGVKVLEQLGTALGVVLAIAACAAAPFWAVPGVAAGAVAVSAVVVGRVGQAWGRRHAEQARALVGELEQADTDLKNALRPFVDVSAHLISAVTLAKIEEHFDETTREYAGRLIHPLAKEVDAPLGVQGTQGTDTHPAMIMVGDIDGSDVRGVIGAVAAGYAQLSARGCELVAKVLQAEALAAASKRNGIEEFQASESVHDLLTELMEHLTFHEGHTELVFVGDACFDRFGVNDEFQFRLQAELSAKGVIYILGNHDDTKVTLAHRRETDPNAPLNYQYGDYVKRKIPNETWLEHIQRVFRRAYYSPAINMLTTHQGLTLVGDYILWAGGYLRAKDYHNAPQKLAADIEAQKRISLTKPKEETFTPEEKMAIMTLLKAGGAGDFISSRNVAQSQLPVGQTHKDDLPYERYLPGTYPEQDGVEAVWHVPENFDWHAAAEFTESEAFRVKLLTHFRPSDDDCRRVGRLLGCTISRGHEGPADVSKPGVLAVNARSAEAIMKKFRGIVPLLVEVFRARLPNPPLGVPLA